MPITSLFRRALLLSLLALPCLCSSGCVGLALLDAAGRETRDEGRDPRYPHQSFGRHFVDSLVGEDHEERCQRCHRRRCCCRRG